MAEIIPATVHKNRRTGFGQRKRHSLRIDMTPMVDLGFLLITFFIFTSKMSEPTFIKLILPTEKGSPMPTKQSGALTILPAGNETVYYYEGFFNTTNFRKTTFKGIRDIIVNKKQRTETKDLFIIIKPSKFTNYKAVVDILDEMIISDIPSYALVKISQEEQSLIK